MHNKHAEYKQHQWNIYDSKVFIVSSDHCTQLCLMRHLADLRIRDDAYLLVSWRLHILEKHIKSVIQMSRPVLSMINQPKPRENQLQLIWYMFQILLSFQQLDLRETIYDWRAMLRSWFPIL